MTSTKSIFYAHDVLDDLKEMQKAPFARHGLSSGWESLDECFLLQPGHLMTITGIPGMGKSEVLDGYLVNLACMNHGWVNVFFSPENFPVSQHVKKLCEKKVGKQLHRMTQDELEESLMWVEDHFVWLYPEDTTLDNILKLADELFQVRGISALIIDPANELDHSPQGNRRDDVYISDMIRKINKFCRPRQIVPVVVAHPSKMTKDEAGNYHVPRAYDINGGAMWFNKSSYILSVHRTNPTVNEVTVYVQKVKYKTMGKIGAATFDYDYQSGRLKDKKALAYTLPVNETEAPW